jgi:hypothetical protein
MGGETKEETMNDPCFECGKPTVTNPRPDLRMPKRLCGNRDCQWHDKYAERLLLTRAALEAAGKWRLVSDDTTHGDREDETRLGEAEEDLAAAIDALTTFAPEALTDEL